MGGKKRKNDGGARTGTANGAAVAETRPGAGPIALVVLTLVAMVSQLGSAVQAQAVDAAAVVLAATAVLSAGLIAWRPATRFSVTRLGLAWTALLSWLLISTLLSDRMWPAFMGEANFLLGFGALGALTLIAGAALDRGSEVRRLLVLVAPWVLIAQIAIVAVQLVVGAHAGGSMPNSTYLGQIVVMLLPWVLAHDAPASLPRAVRLGIAVASVVMLGAAGSRVAAVVAVAWLVVTVINASHLARRTRMWVTAGTVVAVLLAGFVFARAEIVGTAGIETFGERPAMWRVSLLALEESPWVGYGPDGFIAGGSEVVSVALAEAGNVITFRPGAADPHSLVIWMALAGGFVALAFSAWFAVELALRWFAARRGGVDFAPGAWGVVGAVVVYLTAPAAIQTLPLLGLVAGVSMILPTSSERTQPAWVPGAVRFAAAALGALCLVYGLNAATRFGLEETGPEVSPGKVAGVQRAIGMWPMDPHLMYLASLHLGYVAATDPSVAAQRPDLDAIQQTADLDSHNPFHALELARTLKFYGEPAERIEDAFMEAFQRYPAYPLARAEYAAFLAEQGRLAEAAEQVRIAELVPDQDTGRLGALEAARALIQAGAVGGETTPTPAP